MTEETQQSRRAWSGTTQNTLDNGAMLGAKWWEIGDELHCLFQRTFETKFGTGYAFLLVKPTSLTVAVDEFGVARKLGDGEQRLVTRFAIPPLAGFDMALQDLQTNGFPGFHFGHRCIIKCVQMQKALDSSFSDMPMFQISVDKD